jgi:non-specific serine/threonine protein kinase
MFTDLSPDSAAQRPTPIVALTRNELSPRADLPLPLTSFVGREREIAAARGALRQGGIRLLTLTGPGGVGKTRLAVRVAEEVAGDFPDGVWFVPLAPVLDPALVADTVAGVLGVKETASRTLVAGLRAFLRERHALLLLDNFEHVLDAAPLVTDLLATCPRLKVLATSRAVLRLSGEHDLAVAPLALPDLDRLPPVDGLSENPAVRLFVERARAARADFALTADNAATAAQLCHRLDGLPLAIELAAARVGALPLQTLLARLDRRLALLTGGARDQPPRLRTMRDAIAWSHDLLTPAEQALFRRLAVFVGGCTLEAAEAVAGAAGLDVLDGITSLVDKSLLSLVSGAGGKPDPGAPRYGMLETVREYGLEQLAASGEEEATRRAHAAWCVGQAERFWESLVAYSLAFVAWMDRIEADLDNQRTALAWLERTGDVAGVLQLAGALSEFWLLYSHRHEGRGWLDLALDPARGAAVPAAVRARGLRAAGLLAVYQGDYAEASARGTDSLALWRDLGDRQGTALALHVVGFIDLAQGDYDQAVVHIGEAEALFAALGNRLWVVGLRSDILGRAVYGRGDLAEATAILEDALAVYDEIGDRLNAAMTLNYLGFVACDQGDRAGAAARFAAGLLLWRQLGARWMPDWLAGVATLAETCGEPERAARLFGAADALCVEHGHVSTLPERASFERAIGAARAALGEAAFAAAVAIGRTLPLAAALAEAQAVAEALATSADITEAVHSSGTATAPALAPGSFGLSPREWEVLALLAKRYTDKEIAAALFIAPHTAETHVKHVLAKLGAANRREAAALAVRHGLA